ncbi:hypothetical protein POM88_016082 [Heracleum sosnowskyi]|uniref:Uncharacterized protein n=1 Tax=Heracleum sosnowskyi TaxID=360622 RepID=A0AAD8MWS8_9APIA|nr:hypothetical protein POM88_016082 [Heracleum sosnowskyi]
MHSPRLPPNCAVNQRCKFCKRGDSVQAEERWRWSLSACIPAVGLQSPEPPLPPLPCLHPLPPLTVVQSLRASSAIQPSLLVSRAMTSSVTNSCTTPCISYRYVHDHHPPQANRNSHVHMNTTKYHPSHKE